MTAFDFDMDQGGSSGPAKIGQMLQVSLSSRRHFLPPHIDDLLH